MKQVISNDGTKIAYEKLGKGPVLILVLGALNKRGSGKKLAQLLTDHFTVISYDRRGRGDSGDTLPYKYEKEVEDLSALIDELGGRVYLYGHSSGAILSLLAAKSLGKKVEKLAFYELPYNDDPEAKKVLKKYRENLKQALINERNGDAVELFVKSFGVSDKQIAAMKKLPLWKGLTSMAPTLEYDTIKLMEYYPKMDIKDVKTPTLVMYGAASPNFMSQTATKLSEELHNAKLESLPKQTHDVKADVLAPYLINFFNN